MSGGLGPADAGRDSSLSLSPVPSPHNQGYHDNIKVTSGPPGIPESGVPAAAFTADAKNTNPPVPEKVKRPRKKKEAAPGDTSNDPPKEKKPRKPRASNPDGTAASRKKQKTADVQPPTAPVFGQPDAARQPAITELLISRPAQAHPPPTASLASMMAPAARPDPSLAGASNAPIRPPSSGQRYDPIRGLTMEAPPVHTQSPRQAPPPPPQASFTKPSLASLMNPTHPPPQAASHSSPYAGTVSHQPAYTSAVIQAQNGSGVGSSPVKPETPSNTANRHPPAQSFNPLSNTTPMDVDTKVVPPAVKKISDEKPVSKASSATATPKEKRSSPPRPSGSGLLSSSDLFGGAASSEDGKTLKGVDINITIQLNPNGSNTVNIAQEIMKKYGRDAINPRAAAHRERLLQVAAAANRLGDGSGDDMSLDDSDGGDDSNIEMGGMGDGGSTAGEGADGAKKKRRRRVEEYDKEDDFIDDTELAWQESAAVAKDGFFVYSGPLVPKDEIAAVEKTGAATRGRGRGRGRARAAAATGTTHATVAAKAADASGAAPATTTTRGRGRGRGGAPAAPRARKPKPSLSQAERELLQRQEAERQERLTLQRQEAERQERLNQATMIH